ncbi:hypothetical protein CGZ94_14180 [Enemella evansiae]|uniref:M23ase beta-sheet core domain-containing protein n=1 Tax=Enemella evansiae TaxID=2016499 RepID=A0A255G6M5_9ACTN|nr:M23 family metallopeptidase [Enemella evansiae]OYO11577.1 hypothetical protein CGZ94_14180 [Enemella evansiae]
MTRPGLPRLALVGLYSAALLGAGIGQASADPTPTPSRSPLPEPKPLPTEVPCSPVDPAVSGLGPGWGAMGPRGGHTGLDFPAPEGTPVRAPATGVVVPPSAGDWAGTHVVLRHADGSLSVYAHLSATTVGVGDMVTAGQQIGAIGTTGKSFGPHLHLERYPGGALGDRYRTGDPLTWLQARPCQVPAATTAPSPERSGGLASTGD